MDEWHPRAPRPPRLTWPTPLDPTGRAGPTRGQARGPRWRRTSYGLYVPSTVDASIVEQRIVEAAVRIGDRGAVTGWAALRMHGAGYVDGSAPDARTALRVPLLVGAGWAHSDARSVASRAALAEHDVVLRHGVRVTRVERALLDELRRLAPDLREMVVAVDMVAAARLTSVRRMRRLLARVGGFRHVDLVRQALGLADEGSASPPETRLRLLWVLDAGLPPPLSNRPVYSVRTGAFLGRPDLLAPERGPAAEYDGALHRAAARHRRDNARREAFAMAGLESVTVVGAELRDVDLVVARLRAAYDRSRDRRVEWVAGDPGPSLDDVLDARDRWTVQGAEKHP